MSVCGTSTTESLFFK